jgi:S-layer homology domain.
MFRKKLTALLLIIILLVNLSSVLAAPGDAGDPFISQSYLMNQFRSALVLSAKSSMDSAIGKLDEKYTPPFAVGIPSISRLSLSTLSRGEIVNLGMGGSIVVLGGSARLTISSGTVINVTTGRTVDSGGELILGNRYLAAENTAAYVTISSDSSVALDGDALLGAQRASFTDVPVSHWAFDYIERLAGMSIVSGRGNGIFDPGGAMTRADFVTILGRLYGVDTTRYSSADFTDVAAGQYYTAYVQWAADSGIVTGYGDKKFGPSDRIQRSQMALIIVRYATFAGTTLPQNGDNSKFTDDAKIPDWAKTEVYAARNAGLINGMGNNTFAPTEGASRDQVCAIISRLLDI